MGAAVGRQLFSHALFFASLHGLSLAINLSIHIYLNLSTPCACETTCNARGACSLYGEWLKTSQLLFFVRVSDIAF